ncbi:methyltransferase domain-containing protein [Paenibacillus sp. 1001270B_150601_E10]|uniref:methyltransferase domain-containing protein n=1 Tax=Paenibacillus sp. 1001270B_150601_E10 TaxID=2787079 RepID=UPI00189DD562|nr:methyltransferase domain-containing protein [Paenibacillus sp. 1001270B_150601_E10]
MNIEQIDKHTVKKRFSRHAHEYDRYADVQKDMAQELMEIPLLLQKLRQWNHNGQSVKVLDIGCGTGLLSLRLLEHIPHARITLLDLSEPMLKEAMRKLLDSGLPASHIQVVEADAEAWLKDEQDSAYDVILSSAALQWFHKPGMALEQAAKRLRPGGVLAAAAFLPGSLYELHDSCAKADLALGESVQERGQSYLSLKELQDALYKAINSNHSCNKIKTNNSPASYACSKSLQYEYEDVHELLHHIRRIGAGNALSSRPHTVSRRWLREMTLCYEQQYSGTTGTKVRATYQIGLLAATR